MEISQLKQIYDVMTSNGFDEIEIRFDKDTKVKMSVDGTTNAPTEAPCSVPQRNEEEITSNEEVASSSDKTEIRSELVGIFQFMDEVESYRPKVGDSVSMGEKLGKIVTINNIKEVKSPVDGRICEVAVKKESIVDYGRLLFVIEDSDQTKA